MTAKYAPIQQRRGGRVGPAVLALPAVLPQ